MQNTRSRARKGRPAEKGSLRQNRFKKGETEVARPGDVHLSPDELEVLSASRSSSEYTENSLADAAAHAAQCDYCGSLLARYASVTSDLASAKAEGSAQATTQCPPEEV